MPCCIWHAESFILLSVHAYMHVSYCNSFFFLFQEIGRIKFELFADIVPRTAENFRYVCCIIK